MKQTLGLAAAATAAVLMLAAPHVSSALSGGQGQKVTGRVTYVFQRGKRPNPGYDTARITFRSAKKLRPLFLSGRNQDGSLTVVFPELGVAESLVDTAEMAELVGYGRTEGEARIVFDRYGDAPADHARFVGSAWLGGEPRPPVVLLVRSVSNWRPKKGPKGDGDPYAPAAFTADLAGALEVAGHRAEFATEADVSLRHAVHSETRGSSPAQMTVRARVMVKGSELGLVGDDAGDIQVAVMFAGYTDFRGTVKDVLEEATDTGLEGLE